MLQTVIGFFEDNMQAEETVRQLTAHGINAEDIITNVDDAEPASTFSASSVSATETGHENGLTRFFKSLFGSENDTAGHYSRMTDEGSIVISVRAQSSTEAERIADILDQCGAIDVEENAAAYARSADEDENVNKADNAGDDVVIPKIQESLEVGKRTVESGGVRVRSRIVETPVEEHVQLWQEHVNVDRKAVNRPLTAADQTDFKDQDIEMIELAEIPVVSKKATVVEEIRISKNTTSKTENIKESLRKTEVDIENVLGETNTPI